MKKMLHYIQQLDIWKCNVFGLSTFHIDIVCYVHKSSNISLHRVTKTLLLIN